MHVCRIVARNRYPNTLVPQLLDTPKYTLCWEPPVVGVGTQREP